MITKEQCKAARALIDLPQKDLANLASVGLSTVINFESGIRKSYERNLEAIQSALEAKGVIFINPDDNGGAGVRLK